MQTLLNNQKTAYISVELRWQACETICHLTQTSSLGKVHILSINKISRYYMLHAQEHYCFDGRFLTQNFPKSCWRKPRALM